jgi:hypothetical protein
MQKSIIAGTLLFGLLICQINYSEAQNSKEVRSIITLDFGINYWHYKSYIPPAVPDVGSSIKYDGFTLYSKPGIQSGFFWQKNFKRQFDLTFGSILFLENSLYLTDIETQTNIGRYYQGQKLKYNDYRLIVDLPVFIGYKIRNFNLKTGLKFPVYICVFERSFDQYGNKNTRLTYSSLSISHSAIPTIRLDYQTKRNFLQGFYTAVDFRNIQKFLFADPFFQMGLVISLK